MEKAFNFRAYQHSDRTECIAIFSSNVPRYFDKDEEKDFAQFLDDIPGPYFILEDDQSEAIGCGGYEVDSQTQTAYLRWGMIDASKHRCGLGSTLFKERIAHIKKDKSIKKICMKTSHKAEGFYQRFGFVTNNITEDYFGPGLHRCDMVLDLEDN